MKRKRDLLIYLEDIYQSTDLIISYLENVAEHEFYNSVEKQDAV